MPDTVLRKHSKPRRPQDASGAVAFARWAIRDAGTKCGKGDDLNLAELVSLRAEVDAAIAAAVHGLKYTEGFSWSTIGDALGMTRQSAHERWGRRDVPA